MANKYTVMSEEAIRYMCGLIRDVVSLPSEIISNINLADNLTFSNIYIKDLVEQCLVDAKDYADLICGSLIKLTCKKTTTQPTLDNSELNIIYLYSSDGNAPYEQYLKISDTELIDMGITSINLNDYLTVTDAVNTYAKKVDLNTLTTEVTNIKSDFTTHKNDSVAHMTQTEKDSIVKKDDIVSNLDSTVTNNQLVDGKTLVDKFNSIEDNFSRRYDFDNRKHKSIIDRKLAIKAVIATFKKDGVSTTSIDYYEGNTVFIIRYNQGYYYTYIMTSYFNKVFILEYSVYSTDMILWVEDESGELYIRGTIPITNDVIRIVNPFTTNKDKYKLYEGRYTIDENTKTCNLTVSIDCLSPASVSTDVGSLNTLNFKIPSTPRTFDLKAEDDSTNIMRFYLGQSSCQVWLGTAGKRYTGTVTYTIK